MGIAGSVQTRSNLTSDLSLPIEFLRRSAVEVARDLIGCSLCKRSTGGQIVSYCILETEAYLNEVDLASHARFGKTRRNALMFNNAGYWYAYLCYGIHVMLNLIVDRKDMASGVLIRGVEGICGPGRVSKELGIDMGYNGKLCSKQSNLWIELSPEPRSDIRITATPRIGVKYAGPLWSQKPFRFVGEVRH